MKKTVLAIAISGIVAAVAIPRVSQMVQRSRVTQAAHLVAGDLDLAFTLAARHRHPVRLAYTPQSGQYTIADRVSGAVLHRRSIGASSEWKLDSVTFAPSSVDVSPNGLASGPLTVTVAALGNSRRVAMTRAGIIRETP